MAKKYPLLRPGVAIPALGHYYYEVETPTVEPTCEEEGEGEAECERCGAITPGVAIPTLTHEDHCIFICASSRHCTTCRRLADPVRPAYQSFPII